MKNSIVILIKCALWLPLLFTRAAVAQKPELVIQTGHSAPVYSVAFSPDGQMMATGSWDTTVKLWDVRTRKQLRSLTGHTLFVNAIAFSPDGKLLASGSSDTSVKLWDVATGSELASLNEHTSAVTSLAFSPDGKLLASGGEDKKIRLWDVNERKAVGLLSGHTRDVYSVAFSPDGQLLASSSGGPDWGEVKIWDVLSGELQMTLRGHRARVSSVAFAASGKIIATASWDQTIKLWDYTTGQELRTLRRHTGQVSAIAFSRDGKSLISGGHDGQVLLWDTATGSVTHAVAESKEQNQAQVRCVAISPDGQLFVASGWDKTVHLWDSRTGRQIGVFTGYYSYADAVAISPDGKTIASGSMDKLVRLWDASTWRSPQLLHGHTEGILCVAFSPDGRLLASGSTDKTIILWNPSTGEVVKVLSAHTTEVQSVAFQPNGELLASAGGSSGIGEIKIWRVKDGKLLASLTGHEGEVTTVAFSPDGQTLASGSWDGTVRLWDIKTQRSLAILKGHDNYVTAVTFSPDGKILASGGWDKAVRLWDVASGREIRKFIDDVASTREVRKFIDNADSITSLAFSPNGKYLAAGTKDALIKLWEPSTGILRKRLVGHTQDVRAVAFDRMGELLLSASWDGSVKLWSVSQGNELVSLVTPIGAEGITFTPDNYYSTSQGGYLSVAFRFGNSAYPFEQFDLRLNRPDIVLQRLGSAEKEVIEAYHNAYEKRLKMTGFSDEMLTGDVHIPEVSLDTNSLPIATTERDFSFRVKASDSEYLLDRLNVYANDVPVFGSEGIPLRNQKIRRAEQQVVVKLAQGNNKIEVSVLNEKGVESLRQTFNVSYTGRAPAPTLYVLAIGVSKYADSAYNLNYAEKDASDLLAFFQAHARRFANVKVLPIVDREATKEKILKAGEFLRAAGVDDEVVLFLAGHGMLDEKLDYYFGTTDIDFGRPAERGLSYEAIEGMLDGVAARQKLLLMDTCHAGEVDKDETRVEVAAPGQTTRAQPARAGIKVTAFPRASVAGAKVIGLGNSFSLLQELFADLRRGTGAAVISAASGVEYAYEADGNGVFTHAVLEGLKGKADSDGDGTVKVSELREYVIKLVQELTGGQQKPTSRRENLENDFSLY